MDKTELHSVALDEKERRRIVYRKYDLPADGPISPEVAISAPAVADNPFTADVYRRAKEGRSAAWNAPTVLLSASQTRSLVDQAEAHDMSLYRFSQHLRNLIDSGAISTREEIKNADWPA